MRSFLGLGFIVAGVIVGLYVGLYLMLYGGIVEIINGIKAGWVAKDIALGVIRVLLAGITGWLSAIILFIPGIAMLKEF